MTWMVHCLSVWLHNKGTPSALQLDVVDFFLKKTVLPMLLRKATIRCSRNVGSSEISVSPGQASHACRQAREWVGTTPQARHLPGQ